MKFDGSRYFSVLKKWWREIRPDENKYERKKMPTLPGYFFVIIQDKCQLLVLYTSYKKWSLRIEVIPWFDPLDGMFRNLKGIPQVFLFQNPGQFTTYLAFCVLFLLKQTPDMLFLRPSREWNNSIFINILIPMEQRYTTSSTDCTWKSFIDDI